MICPECGKKCVKKYEPYVLTCNPPIHPYIWWCGCGWNGEVTYEQSKLYEDMVLDDWKKINGIED